MSMEQEPPDVVSGYQRGRKQDPGEHADTRRAFRMLWLVIALFVVIALAGTAYHNFAGRGATHQAAQNEPGGSTRK